MRTLRDQLLHVATTFAEATQSRVRDGQVALGGLSTKLFNDGKTLARVASGGDVSTANFEKAMQWFSTNWPSGEDAPDWPEGIARPAPKAEAAE